MARRREDVPLLGPRGAATVVAERWVTRIGPGGWASVEHRRTSESSERVLVRVQRDETDRYRVREMHLLASREPITNERLRAVRVSAIEQLLNLPEEHALIEARINEEQGKKLEEFIDSFLSRFELSTPRDVFNVVSVENAPAPTLVPPDSRGYPEEFYERVAQIYRDAMRRDRPPVAAIAAAAGVPRSTAARWVKEARRRRKLGAAPATGKKGG